MLFRAALRAAALRAAALPRLALLLPCPALTAQPSLLLCPSAPIAAADLVIMLIQVAATLYIGGGGGSDDLGDSYGFGGSEVSYVPPGIAALLSILNLR